ncbi:hotdog fold thioesterase [Sphingobacterium sp. DK4209]|uniref:Hotdog fold thioesterase n=1 Tax=Sphingobacterium zhuxiongii TaxID=2662364 RepID=A0A5Q0Q7A2_9SPHI|nr:MULTISPECIES: hotdog fold thioesterase [unclassified Sphingobacterium]MVZ66358.1 hotdog fold thioesterase [Sphingobacterium sp. DK4209]QGA25134.1 hotdog fold thioesterase [Sphingobacterium sp. dk4302]
MWFRSYSLEEINSYFAINMTGFLDIKAISITEDALVAEMPVNEKVKQPFGILHGGASVVLAESVGSIASALIIDMDKFAAVGLDINANHLRPVTKGKVFATCKPFHIGKTTHVWDIRIVDERDKLVCVSRLTMAIIKKPQ